MAGLLYWTTSGEITYIASAVKTIIQVKSPTNQKCLVRKAHISVKSLAQSTDVGLKARWTRSVSPNYGTGTAAGVLTSKDDPLDTETIQSTQFYNFSAEPTSPTDAGYWFELYPMNAIIDYMPPDKPFKIPGGQSLQLEITNSNSGSYVLVATLQVEE